VATHSHPSEVIVCLDEHLQELQELTGSVLGVMEAFNHRTATPFELVYDPIFGVWLVKLAPGR